MASHVIKKNFRVLRPVFDRLPVVYVGYSLVILMNLCSMLMEAKGTYSASRLYLVNEVYFIAESLASFYWFLFAERLREAKWIRKKGWVAVCAVPLILYWGAVVLSPNKGWLFTISDSLKYERGQLFLLNVIGNYGYMIVAALLSLIAAKKEKIRYKKKQEYILFTYAFMVLMFCLVQALTGYNLMPVGITVGQLMVFLYIVMGDTRRRDSIQKGLAEDFDAVFAVDADRDRVQTIRMVGNFDRWMKLPEDKDAYSTRLRLNVRQMVVPEDRELVARCFDSSYVCRQLETQRSFSVMYRVSDFHQQTYYHQARFIRINDEDGRHQFLMGVKNADAVMREQAEKERQSAVIAGLNADFSCILFVDYHDNALQDVCSVYREREQLLQSIPYWAETKHFMERLSLIEKYLVYEEDRALFHQKTDRDFVMEKCRLDQSFAFTFRAVLEGRLEYYQLKFVTVKDSDAMQGFIVGLRSVDQETRRELEFQKYLEKTVEERTGELRASNESLLKVNEGIIELVGNVTEARDEESGAHVRRVKKLVRALAEELLRQEPDCGLTPELVDKLTAVSVLHDVGKIMIPDAVLQKPGRLTPEEFELMKTHCEKGCTILREMPPEWSQEYLELSLEICRYHHERYDGKGYPCGLAGEEIPLSAQIVAIADCYDALVSPRVYKPAYTPEKAFSMILGGECGAFSPRMLKAFSACEDCFKFLAETEAAD